MSNEKSIALTTRDPRSGGGVRSVMEFAYEAITKTDTEPYLVYNALRWTDCTTLTDVLRGSWGVTVTKENHGNMNGVRIGRRLPEFLVTNYRLNREEWNTVLDTADAGLVLGGPCLAGQPLADSDIPYAVWLGTTIEDEREAQKHQFGIGRRLRYELARPELHRQEKCVLQNAERILAQSTYTKQKISERHGIPDHRIDVVPVPVDTTKFSPNSTKRNSKEVVFVGRLNDPRKNTELLLESFSLVLKKMPDAQLTLVGADPNQRHRALMQKLGIEDNISTPGKVESVVPYLQRAAVFAYPSRQEGFGIAALEAMACGTPVVSTRCGGPADFVSNNETGYLTPLRDVSAFADHLLQILASPAEQDNMGEKARNRVISQYTCDHIHELIVGSIGKL